MIFIILLSIAFIALVLGTFTDIKTREVPDWINYGIIFGGIGIRALYSVITFDWWFLIYGLAGLGLFVGIAYAMFYAGQWGGGDAKMLMGLGALLGLDFTFQSFPLIIIFLINILVVGAVYGLFFSMFFAVKNRKNFYRKFRELSGNVKKIRWILLICSAIILGIVIFLMNDFVNQMMVFAVIVLANAVLYLWIFIKSVENTSMFRYVEPEKLTEGDWIAKEYKIKGKYICGPKDLGIEKEQIKKLIQLKRKGKIKKIKIKLGIPFVPSFLIAFIITILLGAWWIFFL